jgi:hypothetical protein
MRISVLVLTLTAAFAAGQVHADAAQDALTEFAKCAGISDPAQRLKCYDDATRAKNAPAAPPQQGKPAGTPVETFGLPPPPPPPVTKVEEFGKPAPPPLPPEITQITSNVVEFGKTPYGKVIFTLANGQVWRQLDADSSDVLVPAVGSVMKVTIERGFFNSYNLIIDGRNGLIKVTRLK